MTPDEFMSRIFKVADLTKEQPAICKVRLGLDRRPFFKAEKWETGRAQAGEPWLFNISTFVAPEPGQQFRARSENLFRTHVIVLDDIGDHPKSKVSWAEFRSSKVKPHYVMVTREDQGRQNCQVGLLIEPTEPTKAAWLIKQLIKKGLTDPGMRGPNRWARLPGSTKIGSEFPTHFLELEQ